MNKVFEKYVYLYFILVRLVVKKKTVLSL